MEVVNVIKKETPVSAVRYYGDDADLKEVIGWALDNISESNEKIYLSSNSYVIRAIDRRYRERWSASFGDWIVYLGSGEFVTYSDKEFHDSYMIIEDPPEYENATLFSQITIASYDQALKLADIYGGEVVEDYEDDAGWCLLLPVPGSDRIVPMGPYLIARVGDVVLDVEGYLSVLRILL